MINKKRILTEFLELVQVKCSTRQEREVGDLLISRLKELGCSVIEDNAGEIIGGNCGNIVATLKGTIASAPTVMLAAHLDCVEPCANVKPQIVDGVIRSDGTTILGADDKAGVTAILETLRVIKENNLAHGDIQVVFTVAEEGGVNGSKNIDQSLLKADMGYALDSSGRPGKIIVKAPGQNKIHIKIHGKTAHAGLAPEEGINAIVAAGKILATVPQGRIDDETTCNVGVIKGGRATNIVPDLVEISCESRSRNQAKLDQLTDKICHTFEVGAKANDVKIDINVVKSYGPYVLDENSPVVQIAAKAAKKLGLDVQITGTGGGSDANFYNNYNIPCTVLGVGMQKAHTTEEFIIEEDLYSTAALVLQIIKDAAEQAK